MEETGHQRVAKNRIKENKQGLSRGEVLVCFLLYLFEKYKFKEKEMKEMAANVETMFSVREKPWCGLGTSVSAEDTDFGCN